MMSLHSATHSSQMKTRGPEISLRTSRRRFPQNEQWKSSIKEEYCTRSARRQAPFGTKLNVVLLTRHESPGTPSGRLPKHHLDIPTGFDRSRCADCCVRWPRPDSVRETCGPSW